MGKWVVLALTLAACGGGKKESTTPDESGDSELPPAREDDPQGDMSPVDPSVVSNEQIDAIERLLERKRPSVSRCLGIAIDNQELPKNTRGKISLQIVIQPSGKASEVKVLKAEIESKSLHQCVIDKVKEIPFPELPKLYETTYTYGFEAL